MKKQQIRTWLSKVLHLNAEKLRISWDNYDQQNAEDDRDVHMEFSDAISMKLVSEALAEKGYARFDAEQGSSFTLPLINLCGCRTPRDLMGGVARCGKCMEPPQLRYRYDGELRMIERVEVPVTVHMRVTNEKKRP